MNELLKNATDVILKEKIRVLKKKHEEELDVAVKLASADNIFKTYFIDEDYYKYVKTSPHCYAGDYVVALECETLNEAILIAERENPIPVFLCREGGVSFRTEEPGVKPPEEKAECIGGYWLKAGGLRQYPQKNYLNFWLRIEGYLVRVEIWVQEHCYNIRANISFDRHGNATRHNCEIDMSAGYFKNKIKMWSSEEHPNDYYLY